MNSEMGPLSSKLRRLTAPVRCRLIIRGELAMAAHLHAANFT
jgi:hypothetical protein